MTSYVNDLKNVLSRDKCWQPSTETLFCKFQPQFKCMWISREFWFGRIRTFLSMGFLLDFLLHLEPQRIYLSSSCTVDLKERMVGQVFGWYTFLYKLIRLCCIYLFHSCIVGISKLSVLRCTAYSAKCSRHTYLHCWILHTHYVLVKYWFFSYAIWESYAQRHFNMSHDLAHLFFESCRHICMSMKDTSAWEDR